MNGVWFLCRSLFVPAVLVAAVSVARGDAGLSFERKDDRLKIEIGGKPFATYVWRDAKIRRPYFTALHAPNGTQVTRRHPPVPDEDATDHDTMHPGLWMAFGDISGSDFWRNKGTIEHAGFVEGPMWEGRRGSFAVRNRYLAQDRTICEEVCRIDIRVQPNGVLLIYDSTFSGPSEFYFGDQEELGLGVRMATPLIEKNGGRILTSEGATVVRDAWGKPADWCDYGGQIDGEAVGVLLMPDPANFRRSWWHVRDYGLMAANPFGRNAFTKEQKSRIDVKPGGKFRLRFGVLVHSGDFDAPAAYGDFVSLMKTQK